MRGCVSAVEDGDKDVWVVVHIHDSVRFIFLEHSLRFHRDLLCKTNVSRVLGGAGDISAFGNVGVGEREHTFSADLIQ